MGLTDPTLSDTFRTPHRQQSAKQQKHSTHWTPAATHRWTASLSLDHPPKPAEGGVQKPQLQSGTIEGSTLLVSDREELEDQ